MAVPYTNGQSDVFVRNLTTGTIRWVSVAGDGLSTGDGESRNPLLSAAGRWLLFESTAGNFVTFLGRRQLNGLSPTTNDVNQEFQLYWHKSEATNLVAELADTNDEPDIIVRDVWLETNALVSVNRAGTGSGNRGAVMPIISPNGRWVLFQSHAQNLVTNAFPGDFNQLFVRDLIEQQTRLVSLDTNGVGLDAGVVLATFSADEQQVLFATTNNSTANAYVYSLATGTIDLVATNAFNPAISGDGRWVVYERLASGETNSQIWLTDRVSGTTNLVSANFARSDSGNGSSTHPLITHDGRYVIIASQANDLVLGDTND